MARANKWSRIVSVEMGKSLAFGVMSTLAAPASASMESMARAEAGPIGAAARTVGTEATANRAADAGERDAGAGVDIDRHAEYAASERLRVGADGAGEQDDLALAVALPVWMGRKGRIGEQRKRLPGI